MLPVESLGVERQGRTIELKKTEHSDSFNLQSQSSIFNSQFRLVRVSYLEFIFVHFVAKIFF